MRYVILLALIFVSAQVILKFYLKTILRVEKLIKPNGHHKVAG